MLLDTCVLSELRHPRGNPRVRQQVERYADEDLFVSVLTFGELVKGVSLLADGKRKVALNQWLVELERHYTQRILPIDAETTRMWGELTATAQKRGITVPVSDGLIAATALRHGLHVMTRNTSHFAATGALVVDPWTEG